jgi:hypothetical protein
MPAIEAEVQPDSAADRRHVDGQASGRACRRRRRLSDADFVALDEEGSRLFKAAQGPY